MGLSGISHRRAGGGRRRLVWVGGEGGAWGKRSAASVNRVLHYNELHMNCLLK